MRKPPSRWSILSTDVVCWRIATTAPIILFFAISIKLTGTLPGKRGKPGTPVDPEVATMVLACASGLVLFLSAIVALRMARIRGLFDGGEEVEAGVRKVKRFRGGTRMNLEFELDGIAYETGCSFLRWRRTPEFREGTRIPVLVDRVNPKRAVPLALYPREGAVESGEHRVRAEEQGRLQESLALGPKHPSGTSETVRGDDR